MFVSAVFEFGKIDLIGHTLIVVVLLAIVADHPRETKLVRYPWLIPAAYASALALFLGGYYVMHAAIYGTSLT